MFLFDFIVTFSNLLREKTQDNYNGLIGEIPTFDKRLEMLIFQVDIRFRTHVSGVRHVEVNSLNH